VAIDGHDGHLFNAHIQELKPDNTTAVIFVEELGEKSVLSSYLYLLAYLSKSSLRVSAC